MGAQAKLAAIWNGRDVCWTEQEAANPLVTIRHPCYDRGPVVAERAIASALAQTCTNIEVLVVGDGATPETIAAVRWWMVVGYGPVNFALDEASGAWITRLSTMTTSTLLTTWKCWSRSRLRRRHPNRRALVSA